MALAAVRSRLAGWPALGFFAGFFAGLPDGFFSIRRGLAASPGEALLIGEVAHGCGVGVGIDTAGLIAGVQRLQILPETGIDAAVLALMRFMTAANSSTAALADLVAALTFSAYFFR